MAGCNDCGPGETGITPPAFAGRGTKVAKAQKGGPADGRKAAGKLLADGGKDIPPEPTPAGGLRKKSC
jgi:hypothetical protein